MSMSLEERQQSLESPPTTNTLNRTKSDTPNQLRHQQTATTLIHDNTSEHQKSSPTTIQSRQAAITNSTLRSHQPLQTDMMAMHNFGPNSSQHEHQLKNQQQTNSGTDSSTWHNNNNNNNSNNNNNNDGSSNLSSNDHVNDSQQSSGSNNLGDHKASVTDSSKSQANSRSTLNRQQQQQQQQPQQQPQSQSQQYHGLFNQPLHPHILHSTLASRVDQIIRTTLHDSPAYTPPTSRSNNNNSAGNNTNVMPNTQSSNMPLPSSSSSLIFNTATGPISTTSTPQSISSHPLPNSGGGLMSNATTTAPITSIYGSTLSNMSDNLINAPNSNLLAKTSPSHSALAAAAALQSLNQSHVQRSQQQQLAYSQPSPYSSGPGSGSATKPPSNGNGTPVPQAAHGGSIHQMSKLNVPPMSNSSDQHNHLSFAPEQSNVGSLNFSSRLQPNNNNSGNNLGSKMSGSSQSSTMGLSNMSWQDQVHANGMVPRLPPLHGLNGPLPPYGASSSSSSQSPYGIMNPQLQPIGLGSNDGNNMIGSDSDTLSKMNSMKSSPGQTNPMQFREEKSFPMNFPTLLSNKQNKPNIENLRGPPQNSSNEATIQGGIANEKLVVFAYNLLSQGIPGKQQPKKVVELDDGMRNAIQNGEFYSKYGHIASGIIANQIIVPNFSIIDYLRKDRFVLEEVQTIERINGTLGISDLMCLMELVRQRPWPSDKTGPELGKPPQYSDINSMNPGIIGSNCQPDHLAMMNLHHNSPQKGSSFLSSSPNRSDLLGPQGVDRSRRSSQSPSDISRSQLGNNSSSSKFMNAQNPINVHPHQASMINPHQFTSPLCPPNQQQQHTSPLANRSSPFQPPMSVGPPNPLARPPRSHSTIVGLGVGSFNPPYALTTPPVRQPPAAHQSSSRPNLAGLDLHLLPAHASVPNVPVTAHMSSKLPQTPKLQDTLPRANSKIIQPPISAPFANNKLAGKDPMMTGNMDFQNPSGRFDLDPNSHGMSIQGPGGPRQLELANRELPMKRSTTPHYFQPNMLGPGANQIDLARHQEMIDGSMNAQSQMNQLNMGNYPLGTRGPINRNLGPPFSNSSMPPPSMDHRPLTNDLSTRNMNVAPGATTTNTPNDSQVKQYNAMMAAYQQQLMMSNKSGENPPGSMNMMGQAPAYMVMNQPGSQRPSVGEPMHVDILQQVKQPQGQMNSPKLNNQRSIITGSGSASTRKSKKAKPSPPAGAQCPENKASASELADQQPPSSVANSDPNTNIVPGAQPNFTKEAPPAPNDTSINNGEVSQLPSIHNPQTSASFQSSVELASCNSIAAVASISTAGVACNNISAVCEENPSVTCAARGPNIADVDKSKNEPNPAPECLKPIGTSNILNSESTSTKSIENSENNHFIRTETSTESKPSNNTVDNPTPNPPPVVDQPSKYQKLFTKKAWLKNYDLEDQARLNGETATTDDTMPVSTRASVKTEEKPQVTETSETDLKDEKPPTASVKASGNVKNGKAKVETKKVKEGKAKKANPTNSLKSNKVTAIKTTDNDSEETNASTSDLDDTDETDSLKSTNDKKLRRMPRRKVKLSTDRELSELANVPTKAKTQKDGSDKDTIARGRGKKEKGSEASSGSAKRKYNSDDESVKQKTKKIKESASKQPEKSSPSPISKAKKRAGEKFLQTQPCYEIVPKAIRCLECRRVRQSSVKGDKVVQSKQASKTNWDDFCRFFEFRKLRYNKSAQIVVAGFSESGDAKDSDMRLWLPVATGEVPKNISYKVAKFILANIGDEFCKLVLQERAALEAYEAKSGDKRATWKRAVNGLRELCDVCSTTLFNCHYVCDRCGFVVCIDCHESRAQNHQDMDTDEAVIKKEPNDVKVNSENNHADTEQTAVSNKKSKKDSHGWIFCAKNEEHSHDKLTLTKIIAGNCLEEVWTLLHEIREKLKLGECCCKKPSKHSTVKIEEVEAPGLNGPIGTKQSIDNEHEGSHSTLKGLLLASSNSPLNGSADPKQQANLNNDATDIELKRETNTSVFNEDLDNRELDFGSEDDSRQVSAAIEGCIASLAADGNGDTQDTDTDFKTRMQDINFNTTNSTSSRLCHGDLLVLTHSHHKDNIRLFREHWRLGKPVLIRGVHDRMNIDMWLPQFFLGKFGDYRSDLVDCRNGDIHRQSMRKYWDGFEPSSGKKKSKEDTVPGHIPPANNEEPSAISTSYYSGSALWRLKDWPPGQDFNEILPEHYDDFMNNLPLKSYTTRTGRLNLACRLPKEMLKPDLGPKMYSAYGTTKFPERGTTNLHLDISDAVNVMVYVGGAMPFKQGSSEYSEIYDSTINDCYVDPIMKDQIRQQKLIPGALWHIFKPSDVSKIREFLNKVSDECKISHEKRIDPIHDQIWYLDQSLLDRLQKEYGVRSYPILQCMGDAILIPAGAPHQVKNLQNCIKVANDFVSPENIRYCLQLTNEFRNLPETHINQEDKLQIKNIMYHSVKESIQYIKMFESGKVTSRDESSDEDDSSDADDSKTNSTKGSL